MELRQGQIGLLVGAALVAANGVFVGARVGFSGSGASVALSVYTLTLSEGLTFQDVAAHVTVEDTLNASRVMVESVLDLPQVIKVSTFNAAGAAADRAFQIALFRRAVGLT